MCLQSLMFQKKWLIRSFFVIIRPGFEPALFSSLFVAVKETRASGSSFCRWKSQSFDAFLCRIDMLLFFHRELCQYSAFNWKTFYKPLLRAMWLNRSSRIWRSRVQSPAHFWLKQSHLFRGLCPREMASWGQTPFFWSSERMLVCRTIGLSPPFEF